MPLTPGESDRLLLHLQASLAQRRRDRGLLLNIPEARALIADAVCEWARDGLSLPETLARAKAMLGPLDVLPGVPEALGEIRVEGRFDDGTRLVVVKDPFGPVAAPSEEAEPPATRAAVATIEIVNEATTAIGLSSHIHLAEVNPRLRLDRDRAFGMRPDIPTGETVWLVPGQTRVLAMTPIAGARVVIGTSGVVDGPLDDPGTRARAVATLRECGYLDVVDGRPSGDVEAAETAVAVLVRRRAKTEAGGAA